MIPLTTKIIEQALISFVMAAINGLAAGLSYIASQGDITVTIVCTAISIEITQGISYYKD